jgi:HEAT repeat protein
LLPDARSDDGVRFEITRHSTRYPDQADFNTPIEGYDYRFWFGSLVNGEVLPEDWESHLARARDWSYVVTWRDKGKALDSLLLRFTVGNRVVHITDNRSNLIVAVLFTEEPVSLENPEEAIRSLCRGYLAEEVSRNWRLMAIPIENNPDLLRGFLISPERDILETPLAPQAAFYVGRTFAAFAFTKTYPGASPRHGIYRPLFVQGARAAQPPGVAGLRMLLQQEHWAPSALAAALRTVEASLPQDTKKLQAMAIQRPLELEAITQALTAGYEAFVTRLKGVRGGDSMGYELVTNAIAACPPGGSEMRRYAHRIRGAAVDAAHRLQDRRLAPVLVDQVEHEQDLALLRHEVDALCAILGDDSAAALEPFILTADIADQQKAAVVAVMLRYSSGYPSEALLPRAEEIVRKADSLELRKSALSYVAEMAARHKTDDVGVRCRATVRAAMEDPDWQVRVLAVSCMARPDSASVLSDLRPALKDEHPEVRFAAARWYAMMRGWGSPARVSSAEERERFVANVLDRIEREGEPQAGANGTGAQPQPKPEEPPAPGE